MPPATSPFCLLIRVASLAALVALALTPGPFPAQAALPSASDGWQPIALPNGVSAANVHDLAVHPTSADSLFLATSSGVYTSTDADATWRRR